MSICVAASDNHKRSRGRSAGRSREVAAELAARTFHKSVLDETLRRTGKTDGQRKPRNRVSLSGCACVYYKLIMCLGIV